MSQPTQNWIERLERQPGLDPLAAELQHGLQEVLESRPRVRRFLHGEWLDHPLHAALVCVPLGAFATSAVFDGLSLQSEEAWPQQAADGAIAVGLGGALLAALPGLADWSETRGGASRVGFVHALANSALGALYGASLLARRRGHRPLGIGLAAAGFTLLVGSAWLGGELSYRLGVGVRPLEGAQKQEREPSAAETYAPGP